MHQRSFLGSGFTRGGQSEVVRRAYPASGAQWNVQVVRGKVNGKCLWNACKALSLGLLLMVLGTAMATIGYYADHLSMAQEVRGNHTVQIKNESRGFHLNNLSYAGPIVMGVGGFIVVAACVMTFEARDSAAKVVPTRYKLSTNQHHPPASSAAPNICHQHGSFRTTSSQTGHIPSQHSLRKAAERQALTQQLLQFSRGLNQQKQTLKVPDGCIYKSPSAPDLGAESSAKENASPNKQGPEKTQKTRKTLATCAVLNPGLLHRHALSVDETVAGNYGHESLQGNGSQGSMLLDLHLECPVTLKIRDRRRNPLKKQKKIEEDENLPRRAPRSPSHYLRELSTGSGGSAHQLPIPPTYAHSRRRSSNASDTTHTHRSHIRRKDCNRGKLERAVSSDSRLMGATPKCCRHHNYPSGHSSTDKEQESGSRSDTDIRPTHDGQFTMHIG